ncbi:uncharacterized protein LOC119667768 isoform X2 [Teleopsis dalmanni]|uniref:uncharacterized protein LOC119667768 isoform X2 n=1 Tax=Teleopsis dalmanni TaxID=139649 RepID=UPI0018CDD570|nr:uncharacterized protein LOC119667768 isoform X2 [Teleopsis dalmanni]
MKSVITVGSIKIDTKTPTSSYHHQRAPRTPESYFNVPESILLLNIVKSERIQSAFQSNRKNHASVWEMVAEVLNRYSARKRSAKQCCNRYENLKKIYTQLKKNPERHVRRNWPYMFLFKEIEEQRGECWGSNGKRLSLMQKNNKELSYYRRRQATDIGELLKHEATIAVEQSLLHSLTHSTDSNSNSKLDRFLPNHLVETQLHDVPYNEMPLQLQPPQVMCKENDLHNGENSVRLIASSSAPISGNSCNSVTENGSSRKNNAQLEYDKDCNGALNLQTNDNSVSMKSEPLSEGEFNPDDIQLMQTNYNGSQNYYPQNIDPNILHPDVIVDTDNLSDCTSVSVKTKRKFSTSTDGDSTNYELIEYLKRREKRDEELLKRMDAREERLLSLFERTVIAIETLAQINFNKN